MNVPLGSLVTRVRSLDPRRHFTEPEFTYVDISAVDQEAKKITDARFVPTSNAPNRARQLLMAGDVLVSTVRPNLNAVAVVPEELDNSIGSTGFCVLRSDPTRLNASYLFHWVKTKKFIGDMVRKATGASYPAVSDRIIFESVVPLPPLDEQRRIAALLDQAEELRAKRRAAIALLDQLPQAIFLEMFGDPATNPKEWPLARFGNLASKFSDGPFGSNLKSSHYTEKGVRVWRLQNIGVGELIDDDRAFISEAHFSKLRKHLCEPGDVIVGTLGEPNLRAFVHPPSVAAALNKADCVQIKPRLDVAEAAYLCWLCNSKGMEILANSGIQGQTRLRISMGRLREIQVPAPPVELQRRFSNRVEAAARSKAAHRSALAELDALFASLQKAAFAEGN